MNYLLKNCKIQAIKLISFLFCNVNIYAKTSIQNDFSNYLNKLKKKYSSLNHPKSQNIYVQIEYPSTWLIKEGERPYIIQKIFSTSGNGTVKVATINISKIPNELFDLEKDTIIYYLLNIENKKDTLRSDSKIIYSESIEYYGEYGLFIYYSRKQNREGLEIIIMNVSHRILYKNCILNFTISYYLRITSNKKVINQEEANAFFGLAVQMGNSIVLMDKY